LQKYSIDDNRIIFSTLRDPQNLKMGKLQAQGGRIFCNATKRQFPIVDGIPVFFGDEVFDEITGEVKSFYETNPFPSYDGIEDFGKLVEKGKASVFSKSLLDSIGHNKKVLECGCGTGQLSHFLQLNNNYVLGVDLSLHSLKLAQKHKEENNLERCSFAQMDIFNLALADESFDVVISHGVLHHTKNARRAFSEICRKLKPGGHIVVGLYNKYARIPTWLRGKVLPLFGHNIDWVVRNRINDKEKAKIWISDQYYHPHETWHSIDEVLGWFEEENLLFKNVFPGLMANDHTLNSASLFCQTDTGSYFDRLCSQISWLFTISREGALFDMVAQKPDR
jgi:SAM-dependent methyltransferase